MYMRKKGCLIVLLILVFITAMNASVTRVAFSKPGYMMKIPTSSVYPTPYIFRTGFATEVFRLTDSLSVSKAVYFEADLTSTFKLGLTSIQGVSGSPPVEFGVHVQKKFFIYNDVSFTAGIHDFVFQQGNSKMDLDTKTISLFGVISNEKVYDYYSFSSYIGFGTGAFARVYTDTSRSKSRTGLFAGFLLRTAAMKEKGGLDLLAEYDGNGINIAVRIPLSTDYKLNIGITHVENLPEFGEKYKYNSPGIVFGVDFVVPRMSKSEIRRKAVKGVPGEEMRKALSVEEYYEEKLDSTIKAADLEIARLRDSLKLYENQIKFLTSQVTYLRQKVGVLEDSVRTIRLAKYALERNTNIALRHLSKSLKFFYEGDYIGALKEVEAAIELNPNLALAYARRGSIYYKLGDIERATLNWNLALKLDPDYEDVRNILKAMQEYRLRSVRELKKE